MAGQVARALTGAEPDTVVDVVTLGAGLLGWSEPAVAAAAAALVPQRRG